MKLITIISVALAIGIGSIVLFGYLIATPDLLAIRELLMHWAMLWAGVATFLGVINLLVVHLNKSRDKKQSVYSALVIISLLLTLVVGMAFGAESTAMKILFDGIIFPVEAMLMGLLSITLLYAAIRLIRHRTDLMSLIFIGTALLILLGTAPMPFGEIPILNYTVRPWIERTLAMAGARGILIGVALGVLMTGLRILIGADRPYGGK